MKKIVMPVMFVWIAGASVMSVYYDIQRKSNCIEHEGFLKGWLWCKTDPVTRMEFSSNRMEMFVKGLGWPIRIFRGNPEQQGEEFAPAALNSVAVVATEEQFRSAMCALTEMPRESRAELRHAVREYLQDRDQAKMIRAIEADAVPFHLSDCFKRHAVRTMSIRPTEEDFKHFYNASERALLLTLMVDAMSKIADEQQIKKVGNEARLEIQQRNERYYH